MSSSNGTETEAASKEGRTESDGNAGEKTSNDPIVSKTTTTTNTNTTDDGNNNNGDDDQTPSVDERRPPLPGWTLLSQGAEARVWYVPDWASCASYSSGGAVANVVTVPAVCKERFPKAYRHASLDATLLKARTKAETKCLVRCRRSGVDCPVVLGCDPKASIVRVERDGSERFSTRLFLEFVEGTTVREFLNDLVAAAMARSDRPPSSSHRDENEHDDDDDEGESGTSSPRHKRTRNEPTTAVNNNDNDDDTNNTNGSILTTNNDDENDSKEERLLRIVAQAIGTIVAKMHNANVVHGDLTTSNILLRDPPSIASLLSSSSSSSSNDASSAEKKGDNDWTPRLVLIDFGLASVSGSNHEEKAVDLYVLERALDSTHSERSETLRTEILRRYKASCTTSDSVLQRLAAVRRRGRKRECFG